MYSEHQVICDTIECIRANKPCYLFFKWQVQEVQNFIKNYITDFESKEEEVNKKFSTMTEKEQREAVSEFNFVSNMRRTNISTHYWDEKDPNPYFMVKVERA